METPRFIPEIEKVKTSELKNESLSEKSLSELTRELRATFKERAESIQPSDVLNEYEKKGRFFRPSVIDQREQHKYRNCFFEILPEHFSAVELSPITPFGTNASVTNLSQDVLCTTIRGSEVQGDPTTALALEAAVRRKNAKQAPVTLLGDISLATASRILRMQNYSEEKGYMQHYNLFGLYSTGRDVPGLSFVEKTTAEHIFIWINLVQKLQSEGLIKGGTIDVKITDINIIATLASYISVPREEINKNVLNDEWDLFKNYHIDLPYEVHSISEVPTNHLEKYGIQDAVRNIAYKEKTLLDSMRSFSPEVNFVIELNRKGGLGYYNDLCFNIFVKKDDDSPVLVAGGGSVDWSSKLLGNAKEKSISSGFGPEFVQKILA